MSGADRRRQRISDPYRDATAAWLAGTSIGEPGVSDQRHPRYRRTVVRRPEGLVCQRAALLLFEVLGFSAAEIASTMETSTASVNSALQRARAIMAQKVPSPSQQQTLRKIGDARLRQIVAGFSAALENGDADALVALLGEDVTWSMPPLVHWYHVLEAVTNFAVLVRLTGCGAWRHVPTSANGQAAVGFYLWNDDAGAYLRWSINVLTPRGEHIAEITSFIGPNHFAPFGLPVSLP